MPNVGKSTLFNALTNKKVEASNYPFCTIDPNVGVVKVPDERLEKLAAVSKPKKIVPTYIEFVDIAGLVKGASKGEGLGNQFLSHIRECDAICEVVREFKDDNIIHVNGKIDPEGDQETINLELIFADLATVGKRLDKVAREAKSGDKEAIILKNLLGKLKVQLEDQNHMLDQQKVELQTQQSTKAWLLSVTANEESQYQNLLSQIEEEIRSIKAALRSVGTKIGDVKQGDVIAHLGNTGCSTGAHVHFGFYVNGVASDPSGRLSDGTFIWPVENYVVTNRFNDPTTALWYQQNFGIPGHNGIDMYDASFGRGVEGAPIFATADGVAYQVSDNKACSFTGTVGKGIRVDHSDGTKTIYWHVQ